MPSAKDIAEAFEEKVFPEPNCGCWLWAGATCGRMGYGHLFNKGRNIKAHRLSWEIHCGPIPGDMQVLHKCDVPTCVNPDHLFLGSNQENVADKVAKGRSSRLCGRKSTSVKLTEEQVRAIRLDARPQRVVASAYGVSQGAIAGIVYGKTWRSLP